MAGIPALASARDLGAQAKLGVVAHACVFLDGRLKSTAPIARQVASLPATGERRAAGFAAKCLPRAVYGCETTPFQAGACEPSRQQPQRL